MRILNQRPQHLVQVLHQVRPDVHHKLVARLQALHTLRDLVELVSKGPEHRRLARLLRLQLVLLDVQRLRLRHHLLTQRLAAVPGLRPLQLHVVDGHLGPLDLPVNRGLLLLVRVENPLGVQQQLLQPRLVAQAGAYVQRVFLPQPLEILQLLLNLADVVVQLHLLLSAEVEVGQLALEQHPKGLQEPQIDHKRRHEAVKGLRSRAEELIALNVRKSQRLMEPLAVAPEPQIPDPSLQESEVVSRDSQPAATHQRHSPSAYPSTSELYTWIWQYTSSGRMSVRVFPNITCIASP
ncbi:lipid II flippase FtsW, putative [Babesia caballi]|uniref:Lipid II flippase FtsW, putative n=1 Tax=Babesia caballi TaxID=5871 RepID=A0AAV4LUP3_BABCB|nr:lipid II flippase FtsW, putative [Babesia caballi]